MKFNNVNQETQTKAIDMLNTAEDKSKAIVDVIEMLNTAAHADLIEQLQAENEEIKAGNQLNEKLGLRTLSANEKKFYEAVINQSFTFTQGDIIPSEVIDTTLEDVKKESDTLKIVKMAPAGVKKWLVGEHSGKATWGGLTDALTAELTATIKSMKVDVNKLSVVLIVPKAVRELALPLVDRYFRAILAEAMHDGLVNGFLNGTGKDSPIGIFKQLNASNVDGTKKDKDTHSITGFTPASLSGVKTTLSHGGKRAVNKLYLIANPSDVYQYVEPALYFMTPNGYMPVAKTEIEVIAEPMCTKGKAVFTLDGVYTMGMDAVAVNEFKETKALDDCDVFIAKTYANGMANDDDTSYVIDVTKLKEFVPKFEQVTEASAS